MICGTCEEARKNSRDSVYCQLYGILIYSSHEGCKYHRKEGQTHDRGNRNDLDARADRSG